MADEQQTLDPAESGTPAERPEWLNPRYDSVEAQAKAYAEAEKKISELSERAKYAETLEENYSQLAATVEQLQAQTSQVQQAQQTHPLIAAAQDAWDRGDMAQFSAVQAEIGKIAAREELKQALPQVEKQYQTLADSQAQEISVYAANTLQQRHGELFDQAKDTMAQILEANPHLIPETAKYDPAVAVNALENVFRLATYGTPPPPAQQAPSDEQKRLAQTATGAGTRVLSPDEAKQEWDAIRAAGPITYYDPRQQ